MTKNSKSGDIRLKDLLLEVRSCRHCAQILPLGVNPVLRASTTARVLIVGQAPGARVHASGIPWDDPSGDRLRQWLAMAPQQFYDESQVAIVSMGLCYPGKGKSGDLPPPPDCAPLWHPRLLESMPQVELILLVGRYAQNYYLGHNKDSLTERVRHWVDFTPRFFPLPHPSPRNASWLRRNPWFETEVVPALRARLRQLDD